MLEQTENTPFKLIVSLFSYFQQGQEFLHFSINSSVFVVSIFYYVPLYLSLGLTISSPITVSGDLIHETTPILTSSTLSKVCVSPSTRQKHSSTLNLYTSVLLLSVIYSRHSTTENFQLRIIRITFLRIYMFKPNILSSPFILFFSKGSLYF